MSTFLCISKHKLTSQGFSLCLSHTFPPLEALSLFVFPSLSLESQVNSYCVQYNPLNQPCITLAPCTEVKCCLDCFFYLPPSPTPSFSLSLSPSSLSLLSLSFPSHHCPLSLSSFLPPFSVMVSLSF